MDFASIFRANVGAGPSGPSAAMPQGLGGGAAGRGGGTRTATGGRGAAGGGSAAAAAATLDDGENEFLPLRENEDLSSSADEEEWALRALRRKRKGRDEDGEEDEDDDDEEEDDGGRDKGEEDDGSLFEASDDDEEESDRKRRKAAAATRRRRSFPSAEGAGQSLAFDSDEDEEEDGLDAFRSQEETARTGSEAAARALRGYATKHLQGCTCLGCAAARTGPGGDGESSSIAEIDRFWAENYGRIPLDKLVDQTAYLYRKVVQEPLKQLGEDVPDWPKEKIRTHYLHHAADPVVALGTELKHTKNMLAIQRRRIKRRDPSGDVALDSKNVDTYLKLQKQYIWLFSQKPKTFVFGPDAGAGGGSSGKGAGGANGAGED